MDCYELDSAVEREACLLARGDTDAVGDIHEMACHELEADGGDEAVEACLQGLVDKGEISAEVVARFRCEAAYTVPDDPSEQDFQDADEALERCRSDAGFGREPMDDEDASGTSRAPASTLPAPTTTIG